MKKLIIAAALGTLSLNVAAQDTPITEKQQEARQIAKQFLGSLKPELGKAMKSGGPVFAVGKCHKISPEIAQELSETTGWNVKRVSLKPRATTANPDSWETSTLKWFDEQAASGKDVTKLEKFEIVKMDGQDTYRYMKAIPTGGVCLTCHGTAVPANVTQKLQELYPADKATGYHKGEIRGAFSFKQPKK